MDEVGRLWTSLADYYIRRSFFEKARDIFEEGMTTVVTVREFSVIFHAYSQFLVCIVAHKMDAMEENGTDQGEDFRSMEILSGFWLHDEDNDVDLMLARLEFLMDRRPELANSVHLRQNPHNVEQWHKRVELFNGNPTKQILTYAEAVTTVDPMKAVGKHHTLWIAFAKLYEDHNDLVNARVVFDKAVQVNYKTVDNLASIWCEWAEMEIRHKNFERALELLRRATAEPSVEVKRRVASDGSEPVQMKVHRSLRLWTFYVDLEEGLGNLESTRAVYEQMLDLRIATPQIIINYAMLLEEHKYFEDAFKVYEKGVKLFKSPHVQDIWVIYLSKLVKRYGKTKLERARELYEHAIEMTPADAVKPLFLQYAKLEENYGLTKGMKVYDQATKALPNNEKLEMEIYEQAIESGLPDKDVKTMCLKYAELEKSLGEIDRARGIYVFASQFADPRSDADFWNEWHQFEVQHGNKDTFREMLHMERSVSASYSQKDQRLAIDEATDKLKLVGVAEDEMAALERQLAPVANNICFVSAGVKSQADEVVKVSTNQKNIELPEESDYEDDENVIRQKDVPSAVFGGLARKREEETEDGDAANDDGETRLGALEQMKRLKRGV
ncbi:Pre-mRNA-splicing factor SYF1 [Euphorbia peplus]|nr:Pre-mRNA-splicing factor SYF1 [Euphorbia peplus]